MYILFDNFDDTDLNADVYHVCNFYTFVKLLLYFVNCESIDEIIIPENLRFENKRVQVNYRDIHIEISRRLFTDVVTLRDILKSNGIEYEMNYSMNSSFECLFTSSYNLFHEIDDYVWCYKNIDSNV